MRRHLEAIAASPRPAGSAAESGARAYCTAELRALGYTIAEEPFTFSRLPGEWATPAAGVLACLTIAGAGALGAAGQPAATLIVLAASAAIGGVAGAWLARRGVLGVPLLRARATNLVATRERPPAVWLVAHLDSKSQPVPMLARIAGVAGTSVALLTLAALAVSHLLGAAPSILTWLIVTVLGVVAALPIVASTVGARSPGAVDDASGVVTVLCAAAMLPRDAAIGIVMTSAEELGMAGARAFAATRARGVALNVDGVDDRGAVICMMHGRSSAAADAVRRAARASDTSVRFGRTIPGLLTDGVALASAGWSSVTLSRGTLATLARIHSTSDDLRALRGHGIEDMARLLAAAAREIV